MDRPEREWLTSYGALLEWAVFVEVLRRPDMRRLGAAAAERPPRASAVLARALKLRQATYRLLRASLEGWKPDLADIAVLDDELRVARLHQRLGGPLPLRLSWDDDHAALDRMLWPVALDAAELLGSTDLDRIGQCPGDNCGWMFLDESRGRRRRWCDMADCGNVAKVRRFRAREAASR
ncbi:MAG TPA: CGNR zinc finger domain-containing protein, partial [Longimicrobiales bacterium]|nr:CGNR zinc finger domain-containing protein [Longimicrobiales bacterium]